MTAHTALNRLVIFQTLQRLLPCPIIGIAKHLGKFLGSKLVWQLTEALYELVGATALLSGITQLVVVIQAMQVIIPINLCSVLYIKNQIAESAVGQMFRGMTKPGHETGRVCLVEGVLSEEERTDPVQVLQYQNGNTGICSKTRL